MNLVVTLYFFNIAISRSLAWNKANLATLKLTQIIMRHGDRNPIESFPLDPHVNDSSYWPGGLGHLTDLGVRQTHELGRYMRERYDGFISKIYDQEEISAWSSFTDRTIRSGTSFLRGLFPKVNKNNKVIETGQNNNSDYDDGEVSQVVPLRTIFKELDNHIYIGVKCPRWNKLHDEFLTNSPEGKRLAEESLEMIKYLRKYTGLKGTLNDFLFLFDYLHCQKLQNKTLPHWATLETVEFGQKFISFKLQGESGSYEMKTLRSGIVQRVVQNMEGKVKKTSEGKRKLALFSGHDRTIITFLNILNIYKDIKASYASAVIVELHKSPRNKDHHVEIYFRNDSTAEPYKLEMEKCPSPCLLFKFVQITSPYILADYDKACHISAGHTLNSPSSLVIAGAFLLVRVTWLH